MLLNATTINMILKAMGFDPIAFQAKFAEYVALAPKVQAYAQNYLKYFVMRFDKIETQNNMILSNQILIMKHLGIEIPVQMSMMIEAMSPTQATSETTSEIATNEKAVM